MKNKVTIHAWDMGDSLLEHCHYGAGKPEVVEPHAHDVYQLCISVDTPGEYTYRGASHLVPARAISVIHPGEIHAARDLVPRESPATFWMLYFPATLWMTLGLLSGQRETAEPFFPEPVFKEPAVYKQFAQLPVRLTTASSQLERDSLLAHSLQLLSAHAPWAGKASIRSAHFYRRGLARVHDFLEGCLVENPSLTSLAQMAGLSPWHFCRVFKQHYHLSPHAYLLQVRLRHAKRLLMASRPLGEVAAHVGFADQSHLNRHFRRATGGTPGRYFLGSKNVQDGFQPN